MKNKKNHDYAELIGALFEQSPDNRRFVKGVKRLFEF